ncbi:MAG: histidinol-phosphatase HisJ family protein [archaeon]|nr:MAG: histidinol-phosphatase HisJ family protein [archaeon]
MKKGLDEIGFANHFCLKKPVWSTSDTASMIKKVNSLKGSYKIPIKLGVEMDYNPGYEDETRSFIESGKFDYVIGSIHFIGDWNFDSSKNISGYDKWNADELYEVYFNLVKKAAESKLFDIMGHLDLIKKFDYRPESDITDILKRTVDVIGKSEICVEVNTSGLDRPCKEIYPSKEILKLCYDKNIPITLGSDAHAPQEVGRQFDETVKLIKNIGYKKIARFAGRKRSFVEI